MATTIITKHGTTEPLASDLVQGELAIDLTEKTLYSKDSSGNVFKVGDTGGGSPGTFTDLVATDSFTSPGIDDNATSTAITIDSNENVGIGEDAPNRKLSVESAQQTVATFGSTSTAKAVVSFTDANTTNDASVSIGAVGNNLDMFAGNPTNPRVRIDSTGNVGIGGAASGTKFQIGDSVGGNYAVLDDGTNARFTLVGTGSEARFFATTTGFASYEDMQTIAAAHSWSCGAPDSKDMVLTSTGNVGIGETSPDTLLHVNKGDVGTWTPLGRTVATLERSGGSYLQLLTASSSTAGIDFGDPDDVDAGRVFYDNSTNKMHFGTNGTSEQVTIDDTGNVGIGPSAPTGILHTKSDDVGVVFQSASTTRNRMQLFFQDYQGTQTAKIAVDADGSAGSDMSFHTDTSERMRITDTGNVGIGTGTAAALSRLQVRDSDSVVKSSDISSYLNNSRLTVSNASGTQGSSAGITLQSQAGSNNYWFIDAVGASGYNSPLTFSHRTASGVASEAMRINYAGNLGIGDTNPTEKLSIIVDDGEQVKLTGGTGGNGQSAYYAVQDRARFGYTAGVVSVDDRNTAGTSTTKDFTVNLGNDERMRIKSSGNVGIGTDTPTYPLVVSDGGGGGTEFQPSATAGRMFTYNRSTNQYIDNLQGGKNITFQTGTSTNTERMRITDTGNVLVGRTSVSAAATDHGWQAYNTGIVYQYADAATNTDVHRWYNGAGSLVASINARGEGFFLGGATYSGPLKADEIIQDGAPVVDSLQIIRAFMKLRAATADPDSTVEELREKLKTAVDDIIDQFQDQIDNMPTPLED